MGAEKLKLCRAPDCLSMPTDTTSEGLCIWCGSPDVETVEAKDELADGEMSESGV